MKPEFLMVITIYKKLLGNRPIRKYILTETVYPELLNLVFVRIAPWAFTTDPFCFVTFKHVCFSPFC